MTVVLRTVVLVRNPEEVQAKITSDTGSSCFVRAVFDDYREFYANMTGPNPHGHDYEDLVQGEAVGTLFSYLRDSWDEDIEDGERLRVLRHLVVRDTPDTGEEVE